jgi:hypothetical protein
MQTFPINIISIHCHKVYLWPFFFSSHETIILNLLSKFWQVTKWQNPFIAFRKLYKQSLKAGGAISKAVRIRLYNVMVGKPILWKYNISASYVSCLHFNVDT